MPCANRPKAPPTRGCYKRRRKPKPLRCRAKPRLRQFRAQADALKSSPTLIDLRKAERWDGKLSAAIYAGAPIPFLPVDKPTEAPVAATAVTGPLR